MKHSNRLALVVLLLLCALTVGANGQSQNRKFWVDKADRELFVQELESRGIKFSVDAEGGIWYPSNKVDVIDEITTGILERDKETSAYSFEDKDDQALFVSRLRAASIPHRVSDRLGREWIIWSKSYDERVRLIQEAIEDEGSKRARARRPLH